jgi:hypothetical protein
MDLHWLLKIATIDHWASAWEACQCSILTFEGRRVHAQLTHERPKFVCTGSEAT